MGIRYRAVLLISTTTHEKIGALEIDVGKRLRMDFNFHCIRSRSAHITKDAYLRVCSGVFVRSYKLRYLHIRSQLKSCIVTISFVPMLFTVIIAVLCTHYSAAHAPLTCTLASIVISLLKNFSLNMYGIPAGSHREYI